MVAGNKGACRRMYAATGPWGTRVLTVALMSLPHHHQPHHDQLSDDGPPGPQLGGLTRLRAAVQAPVRGHVAGRRKGHAMARLC